MSNHSAESERITIRQILQLFLPLAATSTMMSASVPIINSGLARLADAEANLAAFGLAFGLSILLESPVFALQQAVLAWYSGRGPFSHLVKFALYVGLVVMAFQLLVVFTPLARIILLDWIGAQPHLVDLALPPLRVAVLFPPLIAVRSALQSLLVSRRKPGPIGWGTLGRLICLAVLVLVVAPRLPFPGPVSAMAALVVAVIIETVYVALALKSTIPRHGRSSPAQEAGRTTRSRIRFLFPLCSTMVLATLSNPVINGFIARSENPQKGLAAYAVVMSLAWFVSSPFMRFASVTIALGETHRHRRTIVRLLTLMVLPFSVTLGLLQFLFWRSILVNMMGLELELASLVRWPLVFLCLLPAVAAYSGYYTGVLTRLAHTKSVSLGGLGRLLAILLVGTIALSLGLTSGYLGGLLLGVSFSAELVVVFLMARKVLAGYQDAVPRLNP